jgi:hypothetical protein
MSKKISSKKNFKNVMEPKIYVYKFIIFMKNVKTQARIRKIVNIITIKLEKKKLKA